MKGNKQAIPVALYGMDTRSYKTMSMYLQGPCKGIAVVVDEADAEVDIIDADFIKARDLLEERQSKTPDRPIILLSLQPLSINGTLYVKKPVKSEELIQALKQIYLAKDKKQVSKEDKSLDKTSSADREVEESTIKPVVEAQQVDEKPVDVKEKKKISKHRTALNLTDDVFSSYIGHIEGIDFSDREQVLLASFNSKKYFLNYVQSALKVARDKGQTLRLNTSWKPLIIFPQSNEIWLDVEDKQLRAFSGLVIKNGSGGKMSLSAVDHNKAGCSEKLSCFYDAGAFLWKVAIWTSKGRYPDSIDIHQPVFLKQWPNFTRLLITPHALQIAAILIDKPRLLMDVIDDLKIKPEYVFVFISAANALGLVEQVKRKSDEIVSPIVDEKPKVKNLLGRILGKLRN